MKNKEGESVFNSFLKWFRKFAVITGDVHHPLSNDYYDLNEHLFAEEYVEIIGSYNVCCTLFVTGKEILLQSEFFKKFAFKNNVELGGHTFNAFKHKAFHIMYYALTGSLYGPLLYQRKDILRTFRAFERLGIKIISWRTHSLAGDHITYKLLANYGTKVVSDKRLCVFAPWFEIGNLLHVPITSPSDTIIRPNKDNSWWKEMFFNWLEMQISNEMPIVFLLHPKRMKMLDDFKTFERTIQILLDNKYKFIRIMDFIKYVPKAFNLEL